MRTFAWCSHKYSCLFQEDSIINHDLPEMDDGNRTTAPSISVQIRRSSNLEKATPSDRLGRGSSTEKFGRDSSRELTKRGSSSEKFGRVSSRETFGRSNIHDTWIEKQSRDSQRSTRLPTITQRDVDARRSYNVSSRKSQNLHSTLVRGSTETSVETGRLRAISSKQKSEQERKWISEAENEKINFISETEIAASHNENAKHCGSIHLPDVHIIESAKSEKSTITGLSAFSKGQTSAKSSSSEVTRAKKPSDVSSAKTLTSAASEKTLTELSSARNLSGASDAKNLSTKPIADSNLEVYQSTPFINEDDGLDHSVFPVYPVLNNLYDPKLKTGVPHRARPMAGRRRKPVGLSERNADEYEDRPGSGRLRYHHRTGEDTVPYPGFEIPPTPTAEEIAEIERLEEEMLAEELQTEEEKRQMEIIIAEGRVFDTDRSSKPFTDEDSLILSENEPSLTIRSLSGKRSFCRCPTEIRCLASSQLCKHCGKAVDRYSIRSDHKSRSGLDSEFPFSRSMGAPSRTSREKMLNDRKLAEQVQTRTPSDEDYMDLESIIQDDDARYWSSDDDNEGTSRAATTSSVRRLRNAKPYPLVNPDIHKQVYLQALNEVQFRDMKKNNTERFDENRKLRRPNVFSYYRLWPFAGKCNGCGNDLGIRPDNGFADKKPKQGQLMKHIFGDVKVEDYYPGGSKSNEPKIVLDSLNTYDRSMSKSKSIDASVINSSKKIKRQGIKFAE